MAEIADEDWDEPYRKIGRMALDDESECLTECFSSHRMAERAAIVSWLRAQDDPNEKWSLQNSHWYAAEIEAGAHNK